MTTDRRAFLSYCSTVGLGATLLPGVLWGKLATGADITVETIACAEEIAGIVGVSRRTVGNRLATFHALVKGLATPEVAS
mgnify:CR=1 FL=1